MIRYPDPGSPYSIVPLGHHWAVDHADHGTLPGYETIASLAEAKSCIAELEDAEIAAAEAEATELAEAETALVASAHESGAALPSILDEAA